jgi:hypothetical protein
MTKSGATTVGYGTRSIPTHDTAVSRPHQQGIPRPVKNISHAQIAERAYMISISDQSGTPEQNWFRAERELREGR